MSALRERHAGLASAHHGGLFEECREGDLVRHRQSSERREGHVDPTVLDDAEMLRVQPGDLGGLFLGQTALVAELAKTQPETTLRTFDGLREGRSEPHL